VITAVGPDAAGPAGPLSVGDEVIAYPTEGGYATAVTVSANGVVPKPAELSWEQASGLLLVGATAVHAMAVAKVSASDTLLVHAASGAVGLLTVQLSLAAGATVAATASERNQTLLSELGAVALTYGPGLLDRVRQAVPSGISAAIDAIGTDEAIDVSLAVVPEPSPLPVKTYPLAEAAEAHAFLGQGHPNGKLALIPAP
jgi:NADPH:quinone reductase